MAKITVNNDRCKGCGLCINACPKKCISFSQNLNKIGYHYAVLENEKNCIGCGFCYQVCPDVCIEVYK
ncbi:MAG: 4Fe-4S binding protein [Endomicrobiaceae bacterium]|jgi:2-oxoglutarate ferredoxin oxidoreductase subunit delta|nr:4Fe-4S binding protein [Endomicrobiaceae bacterium]MDD3729878.1 4Fe-4S binding protein [Endomicrobiaceae bacterium]MDD4165941.1 4Fe-4S binding protein [Endomicrobiaceae bacterium]